MAIDVKLNVFEGPLDLLLHLIDKNKIDIYDIPIAEITEQYLEYVRMMEEEDMEIMSEFMVMAATLIDIKCRMLLPKEEDEAGEEIDPREELVRQLLEYKEYKFMSGKLRVRMELAGDLATRKMQLPKEVLAYRPPVDLDDLLQDMNMEKLQKVFQFVLQRQEDKIDPVRSRFGHIEKEDVALPDKLVYVRNYARRKKHFSFKNLLEEQHGKMHTIVTFLAILELIKTGKIAISQKEIFGDIEIDSLEGAEGERNDIRDIEAMEADYD